MSLSKFIEIENDNDVLKCAHCLGEYTHVRAITWFRRDEDCDNCNTLFADIKTQKTMVTTNQLNPSARRDGLRVIYECECCGEYSSMNISQHKGLTHLTAEKCPKRFLKSSITEDFDL